MKGKIPLSEDSVRNDKSEFLVNLGGGLRLWVSRNDRWEFLGNLSGDLKPWRFSKSMTTPRGGGLNQCT
jgi:hypothetical protein